jgi:exodeoxyribonuclease-3
MKFVSWNVNGLRAVEKKGFAKWLESSEADFVCLQEIKAKPEQISEGLRHPSGYHSYWHPAEKPGYSGLVTYTRHEPLNVRVGLGHPEIDREGRVLLLEYKDFNLINTYFPNSQRERTRLPFKLEFCRLIVQDLQAQRLAGKMTIICGDFNIAHKEIDLRNPKSNMKNAGFLPEERSWMDEFVAAGYVDTFREFEKGPGHYTWWSNRPGVREKNIGWRLDYFFINSEGADRLSGSQIHSSVMGSDHCPVVLTLQN